MKDLLYVPYLRRESAPAFLPETVLFLDCGLSTMQGAAYSSGASNSPEEQGALWTSPRLPFAPNEAKYVLNDLLQYGHNVGMHGDLPAMAAGMAEAERKVAKLSSTRREIKELELFELDGFVDGMENELGGEASNSQDADLVEARAELRAQAKAAAEAEAVQKEFERLQSAQKTLLLAWHLEGSALELDALRDSFSAGRELLLDTIGVEEDELSELMGFSGMGGLPSRQQGVGSGSLLSQSGIGSLPDQDPFTSDLAGSGLDVLRTSWRSLLENMLPFLPENASLVTCDMSMVEAMREFDVVFEPLECNAVECDAVPENLKVKLEGSFKATYQVAQGPMWRLLGHKAPVASKPWLDRELALYAVCVGECA